MEVPLIQAIVRTCLLLLATIVLHNQAQESCSSISDQTGNITVDGEGIKIFLPKPNGLLHYIEIKITNIDGTATLTGNVKDFKVTWSNNLIFTLSQLQTTDTSVRLYHAELRTSSGTSLEQCLDLQSANWYGGGETNPQVWPLQNNSIDNSPFVPNFFQGGIVERYFLSSDGSSYFIPDNIPLFVNLNPRKRTLCFKSKFADPYRNTEKRSLHLPITIVLGDDMLICHRYAMTNYFKKPRAIPSEDVFRRPIWSSWAMYKARISQEIILNFSQQITNRSFPVSQIEIDDNWETCYGSETFNPKTFPDPAEMVRILKREGHNVTLWVHPFVNRNCELFQEGDIYKFFVTSGKYNVTGKAKWWNGEGAGVIDVTNPKASDWWFQRLDKLRNEVGINAFKFDAGETGYLPPNPHLHTAEELQPGSYSTTYALFADRFGGRVEVRVNCRAEGVAVFIRMLDRHSVWGLDIGLHSVITSTLHMGLVGTPFVLPDYIGGNSYGADNPDRQLFIRWVQMTAFLPVMQFSITPWNYDEEVVNISRRMVELHLNISDVIVKAAVQATVDGSPIIRPLWWIDPNDVTAQTVNDQFLVGDTYLVAPIVQKNATSRNVYLPRGLWRDNLRGGDIKGPKLLVDYSVALSEIAYFKKI